MSPVAPCTEAVAAPEARPGVSLGRASAVAVAVLGSAILPVILVGTMAAEIDRDIELGPERLGFAVAAFWGFAALLSPPAGRLVDRIGGGTGVRVAAAVSAAASLGIALIADGYPALVAFLAVGGLASALAAPGMSALISRQMRPDRRGTVIGFQQAGPPMATLAAAAALPLAAEPLGWRACFALAAGLMLAAAAWVPLRECEAARHSGPRSAEGVLALAAAGGLATAAASAAVVFLIPFALDEGMGKGASALVLGGASAAAAGMRVVMGVRADRGGGRLVPAGALLAAGAAGFALLATAGTAAIVVGGVLALGAGWGWSGLLLLTAIERRPEAPGAAVGATVSGLFAGAVLGPLVAGVLAEVSAQAVWLACAAASLGAAALLLAQRRPAPAAVSAR